MLYRMRELGSGEASVPSNLARTMGMVVQNKLEVDSQIV
jgi:hypothetical protein